MMKWTANVFYSLTEFEFDEFDGIFKKTKYIYHPNFSLINKKGMTIVKRTNHEQ